ncbi:HIT family protein [Dactylosporangium sp. NPDC051541]|uniref:HIT family protein n=1 Tax=Dactylosporangium sp. NPDC051541 TaxID=3363977 RepID=UPI0037ADD800
MDEFGGYTERDLDRIAVAQQAARLADRLRGLVGGHGHERSAQEWLSELIGPVLADADRLGELGRGYAHARGLSWAEIGAATGVDPGAARAAWEARPAGPLDDPAAAVAELDHWYMRTVWLDMHAALDTAPLGGRLDAARPGTDPSCLICRKYAGGVVPLWAGRAEPPGRHLLDDPLWRVGHGPAIFSPLGTLLIESKRHYLDYAEMTAEELATYPVLLARLMPVIKRVTGAERVHVFSNMDGAAHFHTWLLPRRPDQVRGRRFLTTPGWCLEPDAAAVIERMRELLAADGQG